jgi:hypothetical protein
LIINSPELDADHRRRPADYEHQGHVGLWIFIGQQRPSAST